jgi:hypothetical protein
VQVPIVWRATSWFSGHPAGEGFALEISKIQIDQGTAKYASAYASLPFTWSNLGSERPLFTPNGKVAINLQTENLDLTKLFKDLGKESPLAGQLS